jgi:hypothetical protein
VNHKPHEEPFRRQFLKAAGAAAADHVAPSTGGAAAAAIASSLEGMDADRILDRKRPRALFSDSTVVLIDLALGVSRDLVARANKSVGRGDGMMRIRAGYDALFGALAPGAGARKGSR